MTLDLRRAMNAISEVVQNRPPPIREFDQIYMKMGDMVLHSEFVSRRFSGKKVAFIGDGDGIALSIANLRLNEVVQIEKTPSQIHVFDFDERVVHSINDFARRAQITEYISASLYNVMDALPERGLGSFDCFHVNPPYGQYNEGRSALAFIRRGVLAIAPGGQGCCVVADHAKHPWTKKVLRSIQHGCIAMGLVVEEVIPEFHEYHLEDAPTLKSCALLVSMIDENLRPPNAPLTPEEKHEFYGRRQDLTIKYVEREPLVNEHSALPSTYRLKAETPSGEAEE